MLFCGALDLYHSGSAVFACRNSDAVKGRLIRHLLAAAPCTFQGRRTQGAYPYSFSPHVSADCLPPGPGTCGCLFFAWFAMEPPSSSNWSNTLAAAPRCKAEANSQCFSSSLPLPHRLNFNHTYPKPGIRPKNCQNFLFPSHLEELATFRTH